MTRSADCQLLVDGINRYIEAMRGDQNEVRYVQSIFDVTISKAHEMRMDSDIRTLTAEVSRLAGSQVEPPPPAAVKHLRIVESKS
jgi:hypothetical protein